MSAVLDLIPAVLDGVILPWACAMCLLLLPRKPWSTDSARRVASWTGGLAVAGAAVLSMHMVEGVSLWKLSQSWHWLAVSAAVIGIGASFTPRTAACVALAVFVLALPGLNALGVRALLALVAAVVALILTPAIKRESIQVNFALSISCFSLAALLLAAGSLKLGIVAAAVGATCASGGALALCSASFATGAPFTLAALTIAMGIALAGYAYHQSSALPAAVWAIIWLAPAFLAPEFARRSPLRAFMTLAIILLVCAAIVAHCVHRLESLESE